MDTNALILAILTPLLAGYGAGWVYFQKQQAKIVSLMEERLKDKDAVINRLLNERNAFLLTMFQTIEGTKQSAENTHRALTLAEAFKNKGGDQGGSG